MNDEAEALIGKRSRLGRIIMMRIFVGGSTIVPLPIFDGLITNCLKSVFCIELLQNGDPVLNLRFMTIDAQ